MHSLQVSFQYWTAILDGKNVWCCHMVVNFKPIENELGMWVIHGHTMSYCNLWTYPIGEFVLVAINWRNQLKGDLVIVRGHAIATALWPYGPAMGAAKHRAHSILESGIIQISHIFKSVSPCFTCNCRFSGWCWMVRLLIPTSYQCCHCRSRCQEPLPGPAQTRRVSFFDLTGQGSSEFHGF